MRKNPDPNRGERPFRHDSARLVRAKSDDGRGIYPRSTHFIWCANECDRPNTRPLPLRVVSPPALSVHPSYLSPMSPGRKARPLTAVLRLSSRVLFAPVAPFKAHHRKLAPSRIGAPSTHFSPSVSGTFFQSSEELCYGSNCSSSNVGRLEERSGSTILHHVSPNVLVQVRIGPPPRWLHLLGCVSSGKTEDCGSNRGSCEPPQLQWRHRIPVDRRPQEPTTRHRPHQLHPCGRTWVQQYRFLRTVPHWIPTVSVTQFLNE